MTDFSTLAPWFLLGIGTALLVGIASASVQSAGIAPVGITSLAVGATLGGALLGWAHVCGVSWSKTVVVCTLLMALATVVAEHGWLYRHYRMQWHRSRQEEPALEIFRPNQQPQPLTTYLVNEMKAGRAMLWLADATLIAVMAAGMVGYGMPRQPPNGVLQS